MWSGLHKERVNLDLKSFIGLVHGHNLIKLFIVLFTNVRNMLMFIPDKSGQSSLTFWSRVRAYPSEAPRVLHSMVGFRSYPQTLD